MHANTAAAATAEDLVTRLRPALSTGDLKTALEAVQSSWTPAQLITLLKSSSPDAKKVAALALGLMGDAGAIKPLAVALHDEDPMVCQLAEHSLWAIWFRTGKPRAVCLVKCGNTHLDHGNYDCATEKFTQAIGEDPTFAEAYNQRAIAHYLAERYEDSITDCKQTLARMPQHFGAMSGMGHCYAHLGRWREARHCYRLALAIHPRLEGIDASLKQIDTLLRENPHLD